MKKFRKVAIAILCAILIWRSYSYLTYDLWLDLRIPGTGNSIMAIAFSPDGSTLAYFSRQEPLIHVWDLRTRSWKFDLDRPSGTIKLQYTPTGELVETRWSDTDFATIWNASGQVVKRYRSKVEFETGMPDLAGRCNYQANETFDRDEYELVITERKAGTTVTSTRCDGYFSKYDIVSEDPCIKCVVLKPESSDKRILLSGMTIIADLDTGSISELPLINFSSGGTYISKLTNDFAAFYEYSTQIGRGIRLWDLKKRSHLGSYPYFSRVIPPQVRISGDGKQILVAGGDTSYRMFIPLPGFLDGHHGEINLWDISNSRWLRSLKASRIVTAIDVSPDGRRIAVGFEDGTVDVLNESFTMSQR